MSLGLLMDCSSLITCCFMVSGSSIPVPDTAIELLTDKAHLSLSSFAEKRSSLPFLQTLTDALNLCLKVLF